jgi:hypothetical protein
MKRETIRAEVFRRLSDIEGEEKLKCTYCVPGYRHPVGNCVLCGWGPSPSSIRDAGLMPIPIVDLASAFRERLH